MTRLISEQSPVPPEKELAEYILEDDSRIDALIQFMIDILFVLPSLYSYIGLKLISFRTGIPAKEVENELKEAIQSIAESESPSNSDFELMNHPIFEGLKKQ